ncbi:conserved unknown protein [Ectocarpus siliculosus]|uniref:Carrier domain-containing protein n=1 Tax=Ectocarpus siliculosus TaxID=2880 RepID=D7G6K2_ECTSI|nr:conserved unknown protein [Ectocarpus siliculosus]|eukprot:CBJ27587.1 conserved unknown protein [Ectocarpus siliculosus]
MASAGTGAEEGTLPGMTLPEALEKWVERHPDKQVWSYLDDRGRETSDRVTYRELDDRTKALSLNLLRGAKGRGALSPGDRVLLVYPPSLHFAVAFVACLRAGLVAVPVYPPDPRKLKKDVQAFSRTTASCGARVALTSSVYDHAKKMSAIKAKLTGDDSRWPENLQWLVTDKPLPSTSSSPSASAVVADEATAITAAAAAAAGGEGGVVVPAGVDRASLAFFQYIWGSPGDPKGVKISHGNLASNLSAIITELKAGEGTVGVSWLPQYHDMGLIGSVLGTLYCGGSGYYLSPLDFVRSPPTWITAVDRFRATHLQAPNFAFALTARKWQDLRTKPAVDLSCVVHLINAAEPIDATSLDAFEETFRPLGLADDVIKPTYGLAEHTVFVCSGGVQRITVDRKALEVDKQVVLSSPGEPASPSSSSCSSAWCKLVGCGYPARVQGLDVLVVEPATGCPLPEDRVGEVWLRSLSKAQGYWGLPERSREAFCAMPSLTDPSKANSPKTPADSKADSEGGAPQDVPGAGGAGGDLADHGAGGGEEGPLVEDGADGTGEEQKAAGETGEAKEGGGGDAATAASERTAAADNAADGDGEAADDVTGGGGNSDYHPVSTLELHSEAEEKVVGAGGAGLGDWSTGYLRTGDEGFMHRGELFICGRIKDLVIVGGRNHYPQDLERTAERGRNKDIRPGCSAAFSVPGEDGGELLVITAELREAQVKVSEERRRQLGEEIRAAVVSEHGVDVHHLLLLAPRANVKTTSGKIARQWCRRAFLQAKMKPLVHLKSAKVDDSNGGPGASGGEERMEAPHPTVDPSSLGDEELLSRVQEAVTKVGGGALPDPDVPFYTLGLSSMTAAQFSGLLEQEYGAHVPLSVLDADTTTLRSLVPIIKAEGRGEGAPATGPSGQGAVTAAGGAAVAGVASSQTMVREPTGKCEDTITNSCPCCLCLLSCPCCM